ncbi:MULTISPECIES: hypothetical protein [unclassified Myroides]|uniref:hypothetical protein n=1 Tax=unclassified Myroides TaxID=2642485 RepID=UPI003D2F5E50
MKHKLYLVLILTVFYLQGCTSESKDVDLKKDSLSYYRKELPKDFFLFDILTMNIHPDDSLTTVLYGNEIAFDYLKNNRTGNYPIGSILYGITWKLKEDEYWFGATIPSRITIIERIEITAKNTQYYCFDYDQKQRLTRLDIQKRIAYLKGMKMAIHPR